MILKLLHDALLILIFANVILSWFPSARRHPALQWVFTLSEPLLQPFRRLIRPVAFANGVSMDFSPILCIVVIQLVFYLLQVVLRVNF